MAQLTVHQLPSGSDFVYNYWVADASGCEDVLAAVAGSSHYIRKISIVCSADATVSIGSGNAGAGLTTTLLGPIPFHAAGGCQVVFDFGKLGIKCTEGEAIAIDASADATAGGGISVVVEGRTCKTVN